MATKVITETICDITGDPAVDTVEFAVRGTAYKIDLSAEAVADFNAAVAGFIESAEKMGKVSGGSTGAVRRSNSPASQSNREHTQAIREWARRAGHSVKDRGRIPASVVTEFEQAHRGLASVG